MPCDLSTVDAILRLYYEPLIRDALAHFYKGPVSPIPAGPHRDALVEWIRTAPIDKVARLLPDPEDG